MELEPPGGTMLPLMDFGAVGGLKLSAVTSPLEGSMIGARVGA